MPLNRPDERPTISTGIASPSAKNALICPAECAVYAVALCSIAPRPQAMDVRTPRSSGNPRALRRLSELPYRFLRMKRYSG